MMVRNAGTVENGGGPATQQKGAAAKALDDEKTSESNHRSVVVGVVSNQSQFQRQPASDAVVTDQPQGTGRSLLY